MGFTFRKSIRLPGGFRLNLSKSGVGASWGIPGFRVGTGPSGPRVSAYLPGTGIGWTSSLGGGRTERPARSAQRRLDVQAKDLARMQERERAAHEVASFENRLALLTSLHKESWRPWDWRTVAGSAPPQDPAAFAQWQWFQRLATGIVAGDLAAYEAALQHLSPFHELGQLGGEVEVTPGDPRWVVARFRANGREVIPEEVLSLTSTGKLSRRKMPVSRFWSLYQDHVCSAAFRVARELFALLPIELALVHARAFLLDPAMGHVEAPTVVSAAFVRDRMEKIDFDHIDPSAALEGFPHAMDFSPKRGFSPVDEIEIKDLIEASGAEGSQ